MSKKSNENKYDSVSFVKHKLPNHHKDIHDGNIFSIIEQWPSFSNSRNIPIEHIILKKNRLIVLDETNSKMPKNVPKPQFLKHLDQYIQEEFKKHDIKDGEVNPVRLQIYREVFDWIIDAFKTYQPLLSKIKREYELNLSVLGDEIRRLEPMKEMLWTISEERDQKVLRMRKKENLVILHLKQERDELLKKVSQTEADVETYKCQIVKLSEDLGTEHIAFRKEADSKKLLIADINELKNHIEDLSRMKEDKEDVEIEDSVMLRYALDEAKLAHAKAVKELSNMKATYADVVPMRKYQNVSDRYSDLMSEQKMIIDKLTTTEKALKGSEEKYTALLHQRDFYYLKYMEMAKTSPTTAQEWDKVTDFVSGGVERWQEAAKVKSQEDLTTAIFEEIKESAGSKSPTPKPDSSDSVSNEDKDDGTKLKTKGQKPAMISESENKAVMRTMIEMMCDLPPGSISPNFDPLNLIHILNKEKMKRDILTPKDSKSSKKKE